MPKAGQSTGNSPAAPERAVCLKEKNPSLKKSASDDGAVALTRTVTHGVFITFESE